jgi:glycosyltransferase involved in cell wall biosynthesis
MTISAIIPCYNDGIYLSEAITSLKAQTYKPVEIIVVNDGSNDPETIRILSEVPDDLVKVLHKKNGKLAAARNYGIQHARGELIATLDADDHYHPSFFEKAVKVLAAQPKTGVVTSYVQMFGEEKLLMRPRGGDELNFLFGNECPACALYRRECWEEVKGYDESMVLGYEDWEFYINITKRGWNIHVIPERLFFYRQTKKSMHRNETLPNKAELVDYIVTKHSAWYLDKLKGLITKQQVLYTESRIAYPRILKMIRDRLTGKYK